MTHPLFGQGSARASHGNTWRQVPKIDLLPRRQRSLSPRLLFGAVIVVLLVEVVYVFNLLSDLSAARDDVEAAREQLEKAQVSQKEIADEIRELYGQLDELQEPGSSEPSAQQALEDIASVRIDWLSPLSVLFDAVEPGIIFDTILADPDNGDLDVLGTAADMSALVAFQAQLSDTSDILDLMNLQSNDGEVGLEFSALFQVPR